MRAPSLPHVGDAESTDVPTKDYGRQLREIWGEVEGTLRQTLLAEEPVLGQALERFEAELARYHEVPHAVGVGSGTDALVLMLTGLGLGPGAEVITCAHT